MSLQSYKNPKLLSKSNPLIGYIFVYNLLSQNAKNLCNPLNRDDPGNNENTCSMACIDIDYNQR